MLPPKYFYDGRGSELFEDITRLPEYYQTRAEAGILTARAAQIADLTKARSLVELGSGSSEKTHLLLRALRDVGSLESYVPVDVSADAIEWAMPGLVEAYPGLEVHGVVADFERHLHLLPTDGPRLVAFLGGTIGNFEPEQRAAFLAAVGETLRPGDALLLGTDLVKDPARLVRAYDDAAGVTADFNRNVLRVINRELGGTFDVDAFEHARGLGRRAGVDRDAAAVHARPDGRRTRPGPAGRLRRRGGDAHRDLREVPRGQGGRRAHRGRPAARPVVDRRAGRLRALAGDRLSGPTRGDLT